MPVYGRNDDQSHRENGNAPDPESAKNPRPFALSPQVAWLDHKLHAEQCETHKFKTSAPF
jgi:hypothetical protein